LDQRRLQNLQQNPLFIRLFLNPDSTYTSGPKTDAKVRPNCDPSSQTPQPNLRPSHPRQSKQPTEPTEPATPSRAAKPVPQSRGVGRAIQASEVQGSRDDDFIKELVRLALEPTKDERQKTLREGRRTVPLASDSREFSLISRLFGIIICKKPT
jgi:hypothetical protein